MNGLRAAASTRGLRRQATIRLVLVMLATALLVGTLAHLAYRSLHAREVSPSRDALEGFYRLHLGHIASQWKDDAEQTRARIEFTRILEEADAIRWPKLNAYLNAQWEFTRFSNLFITSRSCQTLFRYGTIARNIEGAGALGDHRRSASRSLRYRLRFRRSSTCSGSRSSNTIAARSS